jgi:hypothetical protein
VADHHHVDLALTSGGTGISPRDVTPEATVDVLEFEIPGIAEAIRAVGLKATPRAMLSRAVAGVRGQSLVINLSGSPKAVAEQWEVIEPIISHAVDTIKGIGLHPIADQARRFQSPPSPIEAPTVTKTQPLDRRQDTLVGQPLSELIDAEELRELRRADLKMRGKSESSDEE